jgi:hypothetical protein
MKISKTRSGLPAAGFSFAFPPEVHRVKYQLAPLAEAKVQAQLQAGLQAGRWRTAGQVAAWLKETHDIERVAKSLYYWLGKVGGALRVPRPCHVKQNPAAVAAFRVAYHQMRLCNLRMKINDLMRFVFEVKQGSGLIFVSCAKAFALSGLVVLNPPNFAATVLSTNVDAITIFHNFALSKILAEI